MRSLPTATTVAGEIVTPHEFNSELREVGLALHGLSQENFTPAAIALDRASLSAWGRRRLTRTETVRTSGHNAGENALVAYPIPDANGDPWTERYTSSDGILRLCLGAWWVSDVNTNPVPLWIGIRVDGVLEAQSPIADKTTYESHATVVVDVPVGGQQHVIECVYGLHSYALGTSLILSWKDRHLSLRERVR